MPINADLLPWLSAAVLAWGLLDCFFGYRVFKATLAVLGGCAGAVFGQAAGAALDLGVGGEIGGLIAGALLGAGLTFLLYFVAVFLAGFGFGATVAMLLLAQVNHMVAWLTGCVLGIIGGVAAVKLQRIVLILATALLGAFRALVASLFFIEKLDWLFYTQQPQQIPALIETHAWLMPAVLVLAAIGTVAQLEIGSGKGGVRKPKKKEADPAKE